MSIRHVISIGAVLGATNQAPSAPSVYSFTPHRVEMRCEVQTIEVHGRDFRPGASVTVVDPAHRRFTLRGAQVQNISQNSLRMSIYTGPTFGWWDVQVQNPDGGRSRATVMIVDQTIPRRTPFIRSIAPARVTGGDLPQTVTVTGGNFQPGLTVTYTSPAGRTSVLTPSDVRPDSFRVNVSVGSQSGIGRLGATNPDCGKSGIPLGFIVDDI